MPRSIHVLLLFLCLSGLLAAQTQGAAVYTGVSPVELYSAKDPSARLVSADARGLTLSTSTGGVRIAGNGLTYQDNQGRWQPTKPQIASDNAGGWKQTGSPADVSIGGGGPQKRLRVGKGADGWDLVLDNVAHKSGNEFSFTIAGQPWRLRILPHGSQIETTITAKQGARTYTLDYSPSGTAASVDSKGNLVIGGMVTRRAVIVGADKSQWSCGPWVADKKAISFTCDDKDLPAKALPYVIDPSTTINNSNFSCPGADDGTTCTLSMSWGGADGLDFHTDFSVTLPAGVTVSGVGLTSNPDLSGNCTDGNVSYTTPSGGVGSPVPSSSYPAFNLTGGQTVTNRMLAGLSDTSPGGGDCHFSVSDSIALQISYMYPTAAPSFSPAAGTYTTAQNITLSSSTPGATIRYTTNGTTPTSSSGTVYTGPIALGLNSNTTIKAIAYASG